jgi:hypothetical protein
MIRWSLSAAASARRKASRCVGRTPRRSAVPKRASGVLAVALLGCRQELVRAAPAEPNAAATPAVTTTGVATRVIAVGRSRIEVSLSSSALEGREPELLGWIERCARAVSDFYGVFPVPLVRVRVRASRGEGIHGGQTLPTSPPTIAIAVGDQTAQADFENNWSMTHEMVHLAFPDVPSEHHWIEEGLATYIEPIARARAGWITEESVWAEWIENMPLGLPGSGDTGLDGTDSWGRTYWGGALFCLVADVELLEQSRGRYGLREALRAIVRAGANVSEQWSLERALRTGDEATGTTVLEQTYRAMKDKPVRVDLETLWKRLGVELDRGRVRFDDSAPLAAVRRAIVSGKP